MQKALFLKLSTDLLDKSVELALSAQKEEGKAKTLISKTAKEMFNASGDILNEVFGEEKYSHPSFEDLKSLAEKRKVQVGHFSTISLGIDNLLFNEKNGIGGVKKIHLDLSGSIDVSIKNIKKLNSFKAKISAIIKLK